MRPEIRGRKTLVSNRVMSLGYIPPVSLNKARRKRLSELIELKQFVSKSRIDERGKAKIHTRSNSRWLDLLESLLTVTSTLEVALLFKNNMTNNRKTAFSSLHHPIHSSFKQALLTAMLSLTSLFYLVGKCDSQKILWNNLGSSWLGHGFAGGGGEFRYQYGRFCIAVKKVEFKAPMEMDSVRWIIE